MRTYRIHGTEHEVNEEKFYYNSRAELNQEATLREVKQRVSSTRAFKRAPGTVYLRSCGNLVAALTTARCRLELYDLGFAIYQTEDTAAVLRMEYVGKCWYDGDPELERGSQSIDLLDEPWAVAVMMKGEDRLEKWRGERDADRLVSLCEVGGVDEKTGEEMELEIDSGADVEREALGLDDESELLELLSMRQKECAQMYYGLGMTLQEIAAVLGTSFQNVDQTLSRARRTVKKYFEKVEAAG
ncbi:MAG: sigma-70 family RNA polymerase sigma factor [Clostridiaceae bacterium]|nr:sigma-70 family RNA polymerase sigma factor [Clostridiaceae bacterium]